MPRQGTAETGKDMSRIVVVSADDALRERLQGVARDATTGAWVMDAVDEAEFNRYLDAHHGTALALALFVGGGPHMPPPVHWLRRRRELASTRAYLLTPGADGPRLALDDALDVERVVDLSTLDASGLEEILAEGLRAFRALGANPLIPRDYLDVRFNELFDWFESTRWAWSELGDVNTIQRELLTPEEIEILHEVAVAEFGTLPAVHNFLREWADEYSFSSWAVQWGAEESRHSLVQCRYLRQLGVEVKAKHAMYKRAPYPMGKNRAASTAFAVPSWRRASASSSLTTGSPRFVRPSWPRAKRACRSARCPVSPDLREPRCRSAPATWLSCSTRLEARRPPRAWCSPTGRSSRTWLRSTPPSASPALMSGAAGCRSSTRWGSSAACSDRCTAPSISC